MNRWQKRIIYILPPLVVAGVYFDVLHVGPIKHKITSYFSSNKVEVVRVNPKVDKVSGEVVMRELAGMEPVKLIGGETLKRGSSITTSESGYCLLTFQDRYSWKVRLGPNTQLNIDELLMKDPTETSIFNLIRGGVSTMMKNHSGQRKALQIRTKFASFSVRGTTFAVLTDGEKRSVLTVREGIVEAENFKESQKSLIRDGHSYMVNREGESKTEYDLDTIDLFNWDSEKVDEPLPTLDTVVGKLGDLGPTLDDQEKARIQLWKDVDEKINGFRKTDEELNRELENLTENAELSRKGLTEERRKIEQDIRCIKTSASECVLSSEKILLQEGFPRLWGTPQYRNSMVVGLQKYLQGREEDVKSREEEAMEIKKLVQRRAAALRAMEVERKNETNPEKIMLLLQDARLRR